MLDKKPIFILIAGLFLSIFLHHSVSAAVEQTVHTTAIERDLSKAQMLLDSANDDSIMGKYDSAIKYLDRCINLNNEIYRTACMEKKAAILCYDLSRYFEGISIYEKVIDLHKKRKVSDFDLKDIYSAMGDCYHKAKSDVDALHYYDLACNSTKKMSPPQKTSECEKAFDLRRDMKRETQWVFFGETGLLNYYYDDINVIQLSNSDIKVWVRLEPDYYNDKDNYSYQLQLMNYYCLTREAAFEYVITYSSSGSVISDEEYDPVKATFAVVRGSFREKLLDTFCSKFTNVNDKEEMGN
jgi:tetratricopeptide (TPR) repeat protein